MNLDAAEGLIRNPPLLHRANDGEPKLGGLGRPIGRRIIDELSAMDAPAIAETGSGVSTLLFLSLAPSSVVSVSPAPELHERIRAEADRRGIDTAPLRLVDDRSERALPLLAINEELRIDAALIDGNHGWPAVFVDLCYFHHMLRPGGLLFIDDIQIYAVAQAVCLLRQQEPHYRFEGIDGKMATFRKTLDVPWLPDFVFEPFILANTASIEQRGVATVHPSE